MILFVASGVWTARNTPQLLVDYPHPAIETCNDVSGAYPPTVPNVGVWECKADEAVLAQIETDSNYVVFWSENEAEI